MLSSKTLIAALDSFWKRRYPNTYHAQVTEFLIALELENVAPEAVGGLDKRKSALLKYLVGNPDTKGSGGANLQIEVVEHVIGIVAPSCSMDELEAQYPVLASALRLDGFDVQAGKLRREMPAELDLAAADDDVHRLLRDFNFTTTLGHLEQAIAAHSRGEWAGANSQLRTFFESLLADFAQKLAPEAFVAATTDHAKREVLARTTPSFLDPALNEWELGKAGGFVQGLFKRLHPEGSHPGLSGEEDSTFRLHLVLLSARHLLRRFEHWPPP